MQKRRARLYNISHPVVENILKNLNLENGEHEIVRKVSGFKYPIKIVVVVEKDIITVIANYPLKKGIKK